MCEYVLSLFSHTVVFLSSKLFIYTLGFKALILQLMMTCDSAVLSRYLRFLIKQ